MDFQPKSECLRMLIERGHFNQCTDLEGLDAAALAGKITAYIGYDATAPSLHVGNLATIMMLRRLQKTGHKPIVLVGGGTTRLGDPSDKTEMRKMLNDEQIAANIASIKTAYDRFLTFGGGDTDAILVNNSDWLDGISYTGFLGEVGRHITINRMVTFDFVRRRLEQELPLTFLEFNYMVMQGYDFVELFRRHGCTLQMGGSDQWGNIVNGVELGRKMADAALFGLTTPLIMTSSGVKMGKSVQGAVWLNDDMLSPYDYWQFWRNTEDADVGRFLRLFTDMPLDEIARLEKLDGAEINEAKKVLAFEATRMCHGEAAATAAAETARVTFEGGGSGADLPVFVCDTSAPMSVADVLVGLGFAASKGEAKRLIEQGGIRLEEAVVADIAALVPLEQLHNGASLRISAGKKRHGIIRMA